MTGCQVRVAEGHLDIAMAGQRHDLGEWSSGLDQSADEGMPERVQTHAGQMRLCGRANDSHPHLIHGVRLAIRLRKHMRSLSPLTLNE